MAFDLKEFLSRRAMVTSNDFPPPKVIRKGKKIRKRVRSKDMEEMISLACKNAHAARSKGFYVASHEAVKCVEVLRRMRTLSLTPRLITQTGAFSTLKFLATNGNPKIRSESRSVLDHFKQILEQHKRLMEEQDQDLSKVVPVAS